VTPVGEAVDATEHRCYGTQAGVPRNHEHDKDLVFDRFCLGYPADEDLPGYLARQTRLVVRVSRPKAMPVMQLPKIMPRSGIA
jgi:hypothetical protein